MGNYTSLGGLTAEIGAGIRLGPLYYAAWQDGQKAFPGGTCPAVGVGGHLLGTSTLVPKCRSLQQLASGHVTEACKGEGRGPNGRVAHAWTLATAAAAAAARLMASPMQFCAIAADDANLSLVRDVAYQHSSWWPLAPWPALSCTSQQHRCAGGAWGLLARAYGLGCDRIRQVTMVDAQGQLIVANSSHNTDLLWASCGGGGGNFGIVTSMLVRVRVAALNYAQSLASWAAWMQVQHICWCAEGQASCLEGLACLLLQEPTTTKVCLAYSCPTPDLETLPSGHIPCKGSCIIFAA